MTDWTGLLKWSLQYSDGTHAANEAREMTEEDKQFLKAAMEQMVADVGKTMRQHITTLKESKSEDEIMQTLEELGDLVDHVDNAMDFVTLGGLNVLLPLVASPTPRVRAEALGVLATATHNHPRVQIRVFEAGALYGLMQLTMDDNETVRAKAISAVSAVIQHCPRAESEFLSLGGATTLTHLLTTPASRSRTKTIFLLPHVTHIPGFADDFVAVGGVAAVLAVVRGGEGGADERDHLVACVASLVRVEQMRVALQQLGAEEVFAEFRARLTGAKDAASDAEEVSSLQRDIDTLHDAIAALSTPQQPAPTKAAPLMLGSSSSSSSS